MRSDSGPVTIRPTSPPTPMELMTPADHSGEKPRLRAYWTPCAKGTNTTTNVRANMPKMRQNTELRHAWEAVHAVAGSSPSGSRRCAASTTNAVGWHATRDRLSGRSAGSGVRPSGRWPIDSGSRTNTIAVAAMSTPPVTAITAMAVRQPNWETSHAAIGGATIPPALPPEPTMPVASPRRSVNHRTTVAFAGTHDDDIPRGAITARPMNTMARLPAAESTR